MAFCTIKYYDTKTAKKKSPITVQFFSVILNISLGKEIGYKLFWTFDTGLQLKYQNIFHQETKYFVLSNFTFYISPSENITINFLKTGTMSSRGIKQME